MEFQVGQTLTRVSDGMKFKILNHVLAHYSRIIPSVLNDSQRNNAETDFVCRNIPNHTNGYIVSKSNQLYCID